ncbi:S8 family serine peptidase [Anabaena sp. FACHB-1237]|uniref:S8 family serine peptidase n=1 Tax=Anabaena sp. FACHB-1237 TaxID=2692769 RepID=UPI001680F9E4|nr:S8 family serine peptidase [Anabaena sp. FACHB-1237]MBD2138108.1 S8 family serine peptidase [Anabaena sp. FACHB-1237]
MKQSWIIYGLSIACLTLPVLATVKIVDFLGTNGIDARKLQQAPYNLSGKKIAIGQVEIGRPGMFGWDKKVSTNRALSPVAVFVRDRKAKSNAGVESHAYNVAGVMVSQDKAFIGVSPKARLYASAVGMTKKMNQAEECLSTQFIALQNGGDLRAINFSFGEPLERDTRPNAVLDGNALLTLCIDWSSRVHDVVYAIAGNQGKGGISIPTDNFNGINVAFSSAREGIFDKVHVSNLAGRDQNRLVGKEFNIGSRNSISIVAPGTNIPLLNPDGKINKSTGTSFAAPQVIGVVALLQEFGDKQLRIKQINWTTDTRRHQVMKVILLNSAEKIKDNGDGLALGMTRTLVDKQNQNWFNSDAYKDPKIPLDEQMGSGHLNAFRAYQQLSAGQFYPNKPVGNIGWNFGKITTDKEIEYTLEKPLKSKSFVSITLNWDRLVELEDKNNNGKYDIDEKFSDRGLNNLDLYLVKDNSSNSEITVCNSVSEVDNVEHIFCPIPEDGKYKIKVKFTKQINENVQDYALAWWTVSK